MKPALALLSSLVAMAAQVAAQAPPADSPVPSGEAPVEIDRVETEHVRLVLLDVMVVDGQGRTVPDLTAQDFEVMAGGKPVAVDTLDVDCPAGAAADPVAVRRAAGRKPPVSGNTGRRVVLALDYLHLGQLQRAAVLEQAKDMVEQGTVDGEELMVVALNGGLRIEQPFTPDRQQAMRALHRMEFDLSLWARDFRHLNERGFVDGLVSLLDVLGALPGNKAVVLFSAMGDVALDSQFTEIAAIAAASRCTIYPVDARGLVTPDLKIDINPPAG